VLLLADEEAADTVGAVVDASGVSSNNRKGGAAAICGEGLTGRCMSGAEPASPAAEIRMADRLLP
jgi:hypothetical protein